MKFFLVGLLTLLTTLSIPNEQKQLLIRTDDVGMSHSVNMAVKTLTETGMPFSASVMFACPWYQEAVDILKDQPQVTVGIHLTLNAEWKNYRWGPVAGKSAVPSLVDEFGFFFPSRATLYENEPTLEDIETELRAQVERAINSGLNIRYVDYHMGTAVDKPEYRALLEDLAVEYKLAISRYYGEVDVESMYAAPIAQKKETLLNTTQSLKSGQFNLLVTHVGYDDDELGAMVDLNPFGPPNMSKHRNAELDALVSDEFRKMLNEENIELLNYADLIDEFGIEGMVSPVTPGLKIYQN